MQESFFGLFFKVISARLLKASSGIRVWLRDLKSPVSLFETIEPSG